MIKKMVHQAIKIKNQRNLGRPKLSYTPKGGFKRELNFKLDAKIAWLQLFDFRSIYATFTGYAIIYGEVREWARYYISFFPSVYTLHIQSHVSRSDSFPW